MSIAFTTLTVIIILSAIWASLIRGSHTTKSILVKGGFLIGSNIAEESDQHLMEGPAPSNPSPLLKPIPNLHSWPPPKRKK